MRDKLLYFLKTLESEIPPASKCHHAITFAQFGSDSEGWEDKLALQISHGGAFHCFFIEAGDFDKPAEDLIAEIKRGLEQPMPNAQVSDAPFRYSE